MNYILLFFVIVILIILILIILNKKIFEIYFNIDKIADEQIEKFTTNTEYSLENLFRI